MTMGDENDKIYIQTPQRLHANQQFRIKLTAYNKINRLEYQTGLAKIYVK